MDRIGPWAWSNTILFKQLRLSTEPCSALLAVLDVLPTHSLLWLGSLMLRESPRFSVVSDIIVAKL